MKRTFRRRGAVLAAALVLLCAVSFADRGGPASFAATGWALLPPAVAIVLAFATKEALVKRAVIVFDNIVKWMDGNPQNVIK